MYDAGLASDGEEDPSAVGYVLVAVVALALAARWISHETGGADSGGRYDLELVSAAAWHTFVVAVAVAVVAAIGVVRRFTGSRWPLRSRPTTG